MKFKKQLYRVDVEYSPPACEISIKTSFTIGAVFMTDQLAAKVANALYASEGAVVSAKLVDLTTEPKSAEDYPCAEVPLNSGDMFHGAYARPGTGMP